MNERRNTGFGRWVAGVGMAGMMAGAGGLLPSAKAIQLTIEPATTAVAQGAGVDVSLIIEGLGTGGSPSLGTFDLNLTYDPSVLTFDAAIFGDPTLGNQLALTTPGIDAVTPGALGGLVNLFAISLDGVADLNALQEDGFVLASLHFTATGVGSSILDLSDIVLGDADGNALTLDRLVGGRVQVGNVSSVPDSGLAYPGVFLALFGAGCGWVRHRRNLTDKIVSG